jgi:sugar phosphate isomerase/epimerase
MRISIASFSFHGLIGAGRMDVFGYLESCRYRYHLGAADLWNGLLGKTPEQQLDDALLKAVRQGMDERDLVCCNFHADGCHPWEDDADKRDRHHALALRYLAAAQTLRAKTFRIDTGGQLPAWTDEQFDLIVRRMREYAGIGERFGCRVGPEVHWGTELSIGEMERLARAVDSPWFGILLHSKEGRDGHAAEMERRLAPYTMHTHVDARTTAERLPELITTLMAAGYAGYWGVEHHSGKNEYREVEYQLAAVRRALTNLGAGAGKYGGNPLLPGVA